jgi:predicted transposase YbfD/YdcC
MVMEFCVRCVVIGTELEDVREGREHKQKQLEEHLLCSSDPQKHWKEEHKLHLDHLDHQQQCKERHHQLLLF